MGGTELLYPGSTPFSPWDWRAALRNGTIAEQLQEPGMNDFG